MAATLSHRVPDGSAGGPSAATSVRSGWLMRLLYDEKRGSWVLMGVSALVLLAMPGAAGLWTLEGRSAVICREMMRSGDYFHPYLFDDEYFDKPLPPYWLMIGSARILGTLNETALRLPGILAGLLAIFCTWRIGARRFGRAAGLTAGWMLATCFSFAFWSRVAGADILNLAAVVGAAAWYTERRDQPGLVTSAVLFAIFAVGAQMKGLIAPVLGVLVILPDLLHDRRWRRHLRPSLALAVIPALVLYLAPFLIASRTAGDDYKSSGLLMAFQENVVRYFKPFDHKAPVYVYAQFLPLYLLPWTPLLAPVLWRAARQWKALGPNSRWPLLASLAVFVFLTMSGSRRNYYILPILPFVVLAIADWVHQPGVAPRWRTMVAWTTAVSAAGMLGFFGVALSIVSERGGKRTMGAEVRRSAEREAPWSEWRVVLYNTSPQMGFYLDSAVRARRLVDDEGGLRQALRDNPRTVVVTYSQNAEQIEALVGPCAVVWERSTVPGSLGEPIKRRGSQVAFIPRPPIAVPGKQR